MRWIFAGVSSVILVVALVATRMMLLSYLRAEFAKFGLPYPPDGFDIETSPAVFNAMMRYSAFDRFLAPPLVVILGATPFGLAWLWPNRPGAN